MTLTNYKLLYLHINFLKPLGEHYFKTYKEDSYNVFGSTPTIHYTYALFKDLLNESSIKALKHYEQVKDSKELLNEILYCIKSKYYYRYMNEKEIIIYEEILSNLKLDNDEIYHNMMRNNIECKLSSNRKLYN